MCWNNFLSGTTHLNMIWSLRYKWLHCDAPPWTLQDQCHNIESTIWLLFMSWHLRKTSSLICQYRYSTVACFATTQVPHFKCPLKAPLCFQRGHGEPDSSCSWLVSSMVSSSSSCYIERWSLSLSLTLVAVEDTPPSVLAPCRLLLHLHLLWGKQLAELWGAVTL